MPIIANDPSGDTIKFAFFIRNSGKLILKIMKREQLKSDLFNNVIKVLNSRPENVYVSEMLPFVGNKNVGGFYRHNGIDDKNNLINFATKGFGRRNPTGGIIFEEMFHALQFSFEDQDFYKINSSIKGNLLMIEAEAKIARLYHYYTFYKSKGNINLNSSNTWNSNSSIENYEASLIYKDGKLNTSVTNYFDTLDNQSVSSDIEMKFRKSVTNWVNNELFRVYGDNNKYSKNTFYNGQTPLFDSLTKRKQENGTKGDTQKSKSKTKF